MSDLNDTPAVPPALAWGVATDPGRVRSGNEDAYVAEPLIFGVADGMGGHQAGEVASAIAATILRDRLSGGATPDLMVAAVVEANAAIFQAAHTNAEQRGMGTTLTALAAAPGGGGANRLVIANVGDSRTYLWRAGRLRRVTIDHSYVQELVSTGHISEEEARSHPRRNIVTRALGIEPTVRVDTWVQPIVAGDRYVLCSDGLVDEVDDDEIARILDAHADPQAAADALVDAANTNGGRDNTTVVVVDVVDGEPLTDDTDTVADLDEWEEPTRMVDADPATIAMPAVGAPQKARRRRRSPLGIFLFLLGLGVIVTITIVLFLVAADSNSPAPTTTSSTTTSTTEVPRTTVVRTTVPRTTVPRPTTTAAPTTSRP